ncbi:MAG: hypothetical protein MN733_24505 [Nitrososphaera sp.]|nr:hypothetical protein [Nitrososphaera sp.]
MAGPRYFFAMFGEPDPPDKDTIESGVYHPDARLAPFPVMPGDILLLYCTESYTKHAMRVPGVGVATRVDDTVVEYRYLPLKESLPKSKLEQAFRPDDLDKFNNRRFSTFWLFEIARASFVATVGQSTLEWP